MNAILVSALKVSLTRGFIFIPANTILTVDVKEGIAYALGHHFTIYPHEFRLLH